MPNFLRYCVKIGLVGLAALVLALPVAAQDDSATDAPPAAEIQNDEGGPVIVNGQLNYTFLQFTSGVAQPIVLLEDQAGFVERELNFIFPPESQVLGNLTSDFYDPPVDYNINLPIEPRGTLKDVDNDDTEDIGVMVYTPAYWTNTFGDPFLDQRDASGGGWSGAYAGTLVNAEQEVTGGMYVIYAPEEGQGFPSGFGADGMLFTEDDPIVTVPQGWTTVDLNTDPFIFDRSEVAEIDLLEPEGLELNDFSDQGYVESFESAVDLLQREYSFTEFKDVDFEALRETYLPRIAAAERENDDFAYKLALRDFSYELPDGHVALFGQGAAELNALFQEAISGGLGLSLAQLDDGRVIVEFVVENGPAESARIALGDEIIAINGEPIIPVLEQTQIFGGYSAPYFTRLQQLRYATRFPAGTEVDVTYRNRDTGELNTVTLVASSETETFARTSINVGAPQFVGPVEYEILPSGYGYVQVSTFSGNEVLTIQDWENFLTLVKSAGIPGIVVDMRFNGGGSPTLATQMAGYFVDEETITGYRASYNDDTGEFFIRDDNPTIMYPAPETFRYDGEVVVMVGPACASACETFSYAASLAPNVTIVGQYPSQGLGGGIQDFLMPENLTFRYTVNRSLNEDFEIHIEGSGVEPEIRVAITEETLFTEEDLVQQAAIDYLNAQLTTPFSVGEALQPGDSVSGTLNAGERVRHPVIGPATEVPLHTLFCAVLNCGALMVEPGASKSIKLPLLVKQETLSICALGSLQRMLSKLPVKS